MEYDESMLTKEGKLRKKVARTGTIRFYINGDFSRISSYQSSAERTREIDKFKQDITRISSVRGWYYDIAPDPTKINLSKHLLV